MKSEIKTAAVLLNYNDAEESLGAARQMLSMPGIDLVVLVDNASTDDSRTVLRKFAAEQSDKTFAKQPASRLMLVEAEKNGGYGYGNNRGVRAAAEAGCDYALIMNPDVSLPQETLEKLKAALSEKEVSAAGARMKGKKETDCAWPLLSFGEELLFNGPVTKRLFQSRVSYPKDYFTQPVAEAGAVHGSLLLVKIPDFLQAGGFDEEFFLFMEEKVLGQRLRRLGKKLVLTDGLYEHAGSGTMKKQGMDAVRRQQERQGSERVYYRKYLNANGAQVVLARLQQALVMLETRIAAAAGLL